MCASHTGQPWSISQTAVLWFRLGERSCRGRVRPRLHGARPGKRRDPGRGLRGCFHGEGGCLRWSAPSLPPLSVLMADWHTVPSGLTEAFVKPWLQTGAGSGQRAEQGWGCQEGEEPRAFGLGLGLGCQEGRGTRRLWSCLHTTLTVVPAQPPRTGVSGSLSTVELGTGGRVITVPKHCGFPLP